MILNQSCPSYADEITWSLLYYRAEIALRQTCAGDAPEIIEIIPGMTVQANIETGIKSILAYLLRPISRGFDNAFSEC